jgi:phage replication O-like protein O
MDTEKKGYTKIENSLIEQFCCYRLSGEEWLILWSIIRKTWGWHKEKDRISLAQIQNLTKIHKSSIIRAIKKLLEKKIIHKKANGNTSTYSINKDYSAWKLFTKKLTVNKKANEVSNLVNNSLAKKRHTKNNITKKNISKDIIIEKPKIEDIKNYCVENNINIDAEFFFNYYEANGWMMGKNRIKDWRALVKVWEKKSAKFENNKSSNQTNMPMADPEMNGNLKKYF